MPTTPTAADRLIAAGASAALEMEDLLDDFVPALRLLAKEISDNPNPSPKQVDRWVGASDWCDDRHLRDQTPGTWHAG